MKKEIYSFISGLLLFSGLAISCDDGKIYDENNQTEREGGTVKLTAKISRVDSWPGGYSVVLAGFTPDNAFAQTAKGIRQTDDGTIDMVLAGIPSEVTQIEVCVINKLRKRIASFYAADYTEQADTIRLNARKSGCRYVQQRPDRNLQPFLYGLPRREYGTCCRAVPYGR